MKVAEIMKELRVEANLTQKELAEKLNLGQATIASYENGTREPHVLSLIAYSDFFDCSIDYLVGRTGDNKRGSANDSDAITSEMIYKFCALERDKKLRAIAYLDFLKGNSTF